MSIDVLIAVIRGSLASSVYFQDPDGKRHQTSLIDVSIENVVEVNIDDRGTPYGPIKLVTMLERAGRLHGDFDDPVEVWHLFGPRYIIKSAKVEGDALICHCVAKD